MTINNEKPGCVRYAVSVIGDKWTGLILRELCPGPATFSSLEKAVEGISPRTLSQRLVVLEQQNVIEKHTYCEKPPRSKYSLTKKGSELQDILNAMADWGRRHDHC